MRKVMMIIGMSLIVVLMTVLVIALLMPTKEKNKLYINEIMASNVTTLQDGDGDFSAWIELYNASNKPYDITGYYLSDSDTNYLKWRFPMATVIPPNSFLLVFASGKDKIDSNGFIHTNFGLNAEGETLRLLSRNGSLLIDRMPAVPLHADTSFGRFPDGGPLTYFHQGTHTPAAPNQDPIVLPTSPLFSHQPGFYDQSFHLAIESSGQREIYYTLDGSDPHPIDNPTNTIRYQDPVLIESLQGQQSLYTHIQTSIHYSYSSSNPFRGTSIKAVTYDPMRQLASPVIAATYFVDDPGITRHYIPVIALTTDSSHFFDYQTGIYVPGSTYQIDPSGENANYRQTDESWERPIHLEFFESNGRFIFAQHAGTRIHGGITRHLPMKSLRVYGRNLYDVKNTFSHTLFETQYTYGTHKKINEYSRFILRNAGDDYGETMLRDPLMHTLATPLNLDVQGYRPVAVYLNGEYFGLHNMREYISHHYIEEHHDIDRNDVTILEDNIVLNTGHPSDRLHFIETLRIIDPNFDMHYATVDTLKDFGFYQMFSQRFDIDSYIDYIIAQVYAKNDDWPGNNLKYWRGGDDGKWRFILFDTDWGFQNPEHDTLSLLFEENTTFPNPLWSTFIFRSLIQNEAFKAQFINRFSDVLNSTFSEASVTPIIDQLINQIKPEIPNQIARWQNIASFTDWVSNTETLYQFAQSRPQYVRQHLMHHFELDGIYQLTINEHLDGHVSINSIEAVNQFAGTYFQGVPIEITAHANSGYRFSHWESNQAAYDGQTHQSITVDSNSDISLTPIFSYDETVIGWKQYTALTFGMLFLIAGTTTLATLIRRHSVR